MRSSFGEGDVIEENGGIELPVRSHASGQHWYEMKEWIPSEPSH